MTTHEITTSIGTLSLHLSWQENNLAAWGITRTWHPVRPDILPDTIRQAITEAMRDYLDSTGWPMPEPPGDITLAQQFVGLNLETTS